MGEQIELSIIVPAYNEEKNLPRVLNILAKNIANYVKTFEIIVVDDGSTDNTYLIAKTICQKDNRFRLLKHSKNIGPGSGIHTGLSHAKGRLVTFVPADLAIAIGQFPRYLEAAKHADVVVGIRSDRSDYSFMRKVNSFVYIWMIKILFQMKQRQFNFVHLYHRDIFNRIKVWSQGVFITAEIMIRARDSGFNLKEVEIDYVPRTKGKASCGRPSIIIRTFLDMALFWFVWVCKHEKILATGSRTFIKRR